MQTHTLQFQTTQITGMNVMCNVFDVQRENYNSVCCVYVHVCDSHAKTYNICIYVSANHLDANLRSFVAYYLAVQQKYSYTNEHSHTDMHTEVNTALAKKCRAKPQRSHASVAFIVQWFAQPTHSLIQCTHTREHLHDLNAYVYAYIAYICA